MKTPGRKKLLLLGLSAVYGAALYYFYVKYVPLVVPFQARLVPLLVLAYAVTAWDVSRGTLFFVFAFPLVNNLPYFFGISETIPHAPAALVLFLFFFLGWLHHAALRKSVPGVSGRIFGPIVLFSLIVCLSAAVTFLRFANFYPLRGSGIYEWITNAFGVSAGGAIMSVVFDSLTYLTGFAFFFIFRQSPPSGRFIEKVIVAMGAGALLSMAFGIYQHLGDIELGNNPTSISLSLVNATFKDALSFGAYLSIVVPFFLGVFLAFKGFLRWMSLVLILLAGYSLLNTGSKSALLSLGLSAGVFALFSLKRGLAIWRRWGASRRRKLMAAAAVALIVTGGALALLMSAAPPAGRPGGPATLARLKNFFPMLQERTDKLWKIALLMMKDYPLSGVGAGAYIIESSNYAKALDVDIGVPQSAENLILHIGSEFGLPGVLLFVWILWEMVKICRKAGFEDSGGDGGMFLFWGAVAAAVSFLINAQSHTYIGSYEIQYLFWLMMGMIVLASRREGVPSEAPRLPKKIRVAGAVLLSLFAASLVWNSSHSLSLKSRTEKFHLEQRFGLGEPETTSDGKEFRWTGRSAAMPVLVEKPVMMIPMLASHPDIRENPVRVRAYLLEDVAGRERPIADIVLKKDVWTEVACPVPSGCVGRKMILLVRAGRTWNPRKERGIQDSRNLGVALGRIHYGEEDSTRPAGRGGPGE